MSGWSKWIDIYWIEEFKDLYQICGVYRIRLADSKGVPIEIGRLIDRDSDGILQIGQSTNVADRIRNFHRACEGDRYAHSEAERLFLVRYMTRFGKVYDKSRFQFSVKKSNDKAEAEKEEETLLKCYFSTYGELPPLNHSLPDGRVSWNNLNRQV